MSVAKQEIHSKPSKRQLRALTRTVTNLPPVTFELVPFLVGALSFRGGIHDR